MDRHDLYYRDPEQWEHVRHSRQAIRARVRHLAYTLLVSLPFIILSGCGAYFFGLRPHEILGVTCFHAMLTLIFVFDTLRSAAHAAFARAWAEGLVELEEGIPVIDRTCPNRRLASLSFALGAQPGGQEEQAAHQPIPRRRT